MRLIDADALNYVRVRIYHEDGTIGGYNAVVPSSEIRNAPTIDAVRHGRWTADESTYTTGEAQCSVCKTTFYVDDLYCVGEKAQSELPNYCPHCGAKMDAERKEE